MNASHHIDAIAAALVITAACAHAPAAPAESSAPPDAAQPAATGDALSGPTAESKPMASPEGGFITLSAAAGGALCAVEPQGPNVVVLGCPGITLKAMRVMVVSQQTVLAQMLAQPGWSATTVRVAEREVDGAVFRGSESDVLRTGIAIHEPRGEVVGDAGSESDDPRTGIAFASQNVDPPLMLTCFGPALEATEQRCRQVLSVLALEGLPAGVRFADAALWLGDRPLSVPAGCSLTGANDRIVCPAAELHWRDTTGLPCKTTPAEQRSMFHAGLASVGEVDHAAVTCAALGQEAACDRWLLRAPNRPPAVVLVSGIGCDEPMAQCNFLNTTPQTMPQRYPAPCDQVFVGAPPREATVSP